MNGRNETKGGGWIVLLLAVLALVLIVGGFAGWDDSAMEAVRSGSGKSWRWAAKAFSRYGDFPWLLGGGMVALAISLQMRGREWARIFTAMILAAAFAGLFTNIVKLSVGRVRPRVENVEHGWYGPIHEGVMVSLKHDFQSFPSSHSSCVFGFFVPLLLSRRWLGAVGILAAIGVGWGRIQLNAHHISDVGVGALIGVIAGWLVWRWIVKNKGLVRWLG